MLFFIFIALFAISVLAIIYTDEMSGWHLLATIAVVLTLIALLISPIGLASVYIDGEKFINEIPCDSEGRELATLNQNASKANDNW